MGNSECVGFSNATYSDVKLGIHSNKKVIIKSETEVGGGIDVGAKEVKVGVEGHYKSKEEAAYYLVDPHFEGFTTVSTGTRLDLKNHPCAKDDEAYITIIIMYDDGSIDVHTSNFPVNGESCNYMLGTNIDGRNELVKLGKKSTWRANGTDGTQNYYGDKVCDGCGEQVECKENCTELAKFGGHEE